MDEAQHLPGADVEWDLKKEYGSDEGWALVSTLAYPNQNLKINEIKDVIDGETLVVKTSNLFDATTTSSSSSAAATTTTASPTLTTTLSTSTVPTKTATMATTTTTSSSSTTTTVAAAATTSSATTTLAAATTTTTSSQIEVSETKLPAIAQNRMKINQNHTPQITKKKWSSIFTPSASLQTKEIIVGRRLTSSINLELLPQKVPLTRHVSMMMFPKLGEPAVTPTPQVIDQVAM
jgi:hypothetical protein